MKILTLLSLFLVMGSSYAQQETTTPNSKLDKNSAPVAPAVFYSSSAEDKTIRPADIDVEVPVYLPRKEVEKVFKAIKESLFFLEVNPLRMSGGSLDFNSNNSVDSHRELELDYSSFNFKLMPLDFKFGFENEGWGSFAEVLIEDGNENSELVVFGKAAGHKIGGGLVVKVTSEELTATSSGVARVKAETKSTELGAYFYASFSLVNNDILNLDLWNKFGGGYERSQSSGTKVKGVFFKINPGIDMMFKINSKLMIGSGVEFSYTRLGGDIEITGLKSLSGVGNTFEYELNFIKTKFLF